MSDILNKILGPLTNPASAPNILMGVFHPDLVGIQIRALQRLGAEHALVVYGKDGMDEISLGAATVVGELKNGEITAAAQVMREFSTKVEVLDKTHLIDIVGTGGDGSHTFNISTASTFVAAAAGDRKSTRLNSSHQ